VGTARTLDELPAVLIVPEAAEVLRVHAQTIYLMIERKALRAVRIGRGQRSIRIEKGEIERIMRGEQAPTE
jgi:excisionase family DNA binding protein